MNKIYLIGNLIKDPALKAVPSGQSVCEFTIAVNRKEWKTDEDKPHPAQDGFTDISSDDIPF